MAPAVADVEGPGFSIREMRVEDVHDAGEVLYRAFYVDSLASDVPPAFNAPSVEAGRSLIVPMVAHPSNYKLAAFDGEGKVIGFAIIDMGFSSRQMEEADVKACGELFSKGMGYGRENDIRAMLARWPEGCWVATNNDDAIVGYTTGLFLLGHAMASSEAAWVAVVSGAIQAKAGVVACVTIPGVYYPRLINWALAAKLVLARHNWYMVVGDYQKPKDGFFWSPSIQH